MDRSFKKLLKEKAVAFAQVAKYRQQAIEWTDLDPESQRIAELENQFNAKVNTHKSFGGYMYSQVLTWLYLMDERPDATSLDAGIITDTNDRLLFSSLANAYQFANQMVEEKCALISLIANSRNLHQLEVAYPVLFRAIRLQNSNDIKVKLPLLKPIIFDTQFFWFLMNDEKFTSLYKRFHQDIASAANYRSLPGTSETTAKKIKIGHKSKNVSFVFNPDKHTEEFKIISAIKKLLNIRTEPSRQSELYAAIGEITDVDTLEAIRLTSFKSLKDACEFSSNVSKAVKADFYYGILQILCYEGVATPKDTDPKEINDKEEMITRKRCVEKLFFIT